MTAINDEVLGAVELLSDFSEEFTRLLYRESQMATVTKPEILKAVDILFEFSPDERRHVSSVYNARQKAWMDRQSQFDGYYKKGKAEGKAEGIEEGKVRTARNSKALGIPAEIIIKATGMTPEEIAKL